MTWQQVQVVFDFESDQSVQLSERTGTVVRRDMEFYPMGAQISKVIQSHE